MIKPYSIFIILYDMYFIIQFYIINQMHSYLPKFLTSLSIFLIIFIQLPHHSVSQSTYTLTKQFFTNIFSDDDITGTSNPWTISGANVPSYRYFTYCNGIQLFGGYEVLSGDTTDPAWIQKSWSNLPPHYQAVISMKIYKIDSWNSDSFFVMVDGTSKQIFTWGSTTGTSDICGQPSPFINSLNPQYNEYVQTLSLTIPHTSSSLSLKLISSLKSWTGSWGIRQLQITLNRCPLSCLNCLNATHCSACDATNNLVLIGQFCECSVAGNRRLIQTGCPVTQCVSCISTTCPVGYYDYNTTSCASCQAACATCIGPGSLSPDCTSCNAAGGYINPGTGVCTLCFGFCATCTGLLQTQCTSCQYGSFYNANQCGTTCPAGFYGSQNLKMCVACNSPCATCDGSTANHCLSCVTGFALHMTTCSNPCPGSQFSYNGLCNAFCPIGTYPDTVNAVCVNCPALCDTCDMMSNCIGCSTGAFFNPIDRRCYSPCPGNYYGQNVTKVCTLCDLTCLTCHGSSPSDCDSCPPLTYLVYGSCYSTCPPHTYSFSCQLCDTSCLDCTGPSSNECTSCNKMYMLHLNESKCLTSCYDGDISDNAGMTCFTCPVGLVGYFKKCVSCHPSCKTCNGVLFTNCLSCTNVQNNSTDLVYMNNNLNGRDITLFQKSHVCIYKQTKIIYMPQVTSTSHSLFTLLQFFVWTNLAVTLLLQIIFKYKTNLLLTIQTMQLLSYLYYFSTPFSQSNQIIFIFLYFAHPTALIQFFNLLPSLSTMFNVPDNPNANSMFPRAFLMQKTSIFIIDSFFLHVIMLVIVILFVIVRIAKQNCEFFYSKINPYILTYSFRVMFMEFALSLIIFFTYISLSETIMRASLAILILDFLAIALSFFWKVRTELQPDHAHYAMFYFNQLGPRRINNQYLQLTEAQQKQRKSILPSLVFYFSRIPLILTIILFHEQPLAQSICLLIYSVFLLGINYAIEHRRRIYRFMTLFSYFSLVICSSLMVVMCCGIDVAVGIDIWILLVFLGFLICTGGQIIGNWEFFASFFAYLISRFCKKKNQK